MLQSLGPGHSNYGRREFDNPKSCLFSVADLDAALGGLEAKQQQAEVPLPPLCLDAAGGKLPWLARGGLGLRKLQSKARAQAARTAPRAASRSLPPGGERHGRQTVSGWVRGSVRSRPTLPGMWWHWPSRAPGTDGSALPHRQLPLPQPAQPPRRAAQTPCPEPVWSHRPDTAAEPALCPWCPSPWHPAGGWSGFSPVLGAELALGDAARAHIRPVAGFNSH